MKKDWECEEHGTEGWRGEHCKKCYEEQQLKVHQCPELECHKRIVKAHQLSCGHPKEWLFDGKCEACENTKSSALDTQIAGSHYKNLKIQPVEYIHANNIPFIEGSVIKYVTRWREKGGVKDLEKAKHFIELLIELENKNAGKTDRIEGV